MIYAVLAGFLGALLVPWICRWAGSRAGQVIAFLPLGLTIYFTTLIGSISTTPLLFSNEWVPSLQINFTFYVDGLSLLFALLISGMGTLIIFYGSSYLEGHPLLSRFYAFLLIFMGSMLGLVLAGNILTLFIFWELTSISSYLLIGFEHRQTAARAAAFQALIVTGGGGLALMAGLIMLGQAGGSLELTDLLSQGELIRQNALYAPILILILLGAFTKSAQFPFHFWLPGAMAAPTPVSAYLHSATMVKAGVYLLARLSPMLAGTDLWFYIVTTIGTITMLVGVWALFKTDLKQILAYSTISALGTLVMLLGLGTEDGIKAAMVFLIVHALYKGALFLVAGAVDHETGKPASATD
jgi:multicomponent Na+:H+ antiporter subunit A